MSWGYRRRVKVLPGVHLNIGKRGVSTSFGRRGANITFGKRGTFLNLGIPGTGLYSRQRIGNGTETTAYNHDSTEANDDTAQDGCFKTGFLFCTRAALVVVALLIMVENLAWGLGFSAAVIVVALMVHYCFRKKPLPDQPATIVEPAPQPPVNKTTEPPLPVSRVYFYNIVPDVEKIIDFYHTLCNDTNFMKILSDGKVKLNVVNHGQYSSPADQLKAAFWVDMTKCLLDLGYDLDLKNTNNFGLFYFLLRTNGLDKFEYDQLYMAYSEDMIQTCTDFAMQLKQNIETNTFALSQHPFFVSFLLNQYDTDLSRQYLVMMYRYASYVAKVDGFIDEKESAWLGEILKQSQNDDQLNNQSNIEKNDSSSMSVSPKATIHKVEKLPTLDSLIGLAPVKNDIATLTNFIKIQKERETKGMKTTPVSCHCVFTGNPGTGKTTVARILANIYKQLGVISKGQLVETDRSGLVAEYVGQTAIKTNKIIDTAMDGVLFIDEAYSLISQGDNDYGKEAIATLLKRMEDDRDRLIVILAGYTEEMKEFINSNPGLQSRFNRYIEFPDYSADELFQIFESNLKKSDYYLADDAARALKDYLIKTVTHKDKNFGNARFVRNLFEKTIELQANRLANELNLTNDKLSLICTIDLPLS